jgi:hypothetical protein
LSPHQSPDDLEDPKAVFFRSFREWCCINPSLRKWKEGEGDRGEDAVFHRLREKDNSVQDVQGTFSALFSRIILYDF